MRYFCKKCHACCENELYVCPACGNWDKFVPDVSLARFRSDHVSVITARQLSARRPRRSSVWSLGEVPFRPPFTVTAYGLPGGGKSTWLFRLAGELVHMDQRILIVTAEEGLGETVSERLRRLEVREDEIFLAGNINYPDTLHLAKENDITTVMLDSWNASVWSAVDVDAIRDDYVFITTLQTTKEGTAAGPQALLHLADLVLHIQDMKVTVEKSRWGSSMVTPVLGEVVNG